MPLNGDPGFNIPGTDHQDSPKMKTDLFVLYILILSPYQITSIFDMLLRG